MNQVVAQRSWTQNDEPGGGKWLAITILGTLLFAAGYAFYLAMSAPRAPQTHATVIAITKYQQRVLPSVGFADWPLKSKIEAFASQGLKPWQYFDTTPPSTADAIEAAFKSLDDQFLESGGEDMDTALVYLRGHALVIDGETHLLAGEFEPADMLNDQRQASLKFAEILSLLDKIPANNIVLLADICDLTSALQFGVPANNVSEVLQREVAAFPRERPIWIITAAAALQSTHTSYLRERTLLQSASEYALNSRRVPKDEKFLSLADFYTSVLQYSCEVTGGPDDNAQTPLLMRTGIDGWLTEAAPGEAAIQEWKRATTVFLASTAPPDEAADANAQDEQTASTDSSARAEFAKLNSAALRPAASANRPNGSNWQSLLASPSTLGFTTPWQQANNSTSGTSSKQSSASQSSTSQSSAAQDSSNDDGVGGRDLSAASAAEDDSNQTAIDASPWLQFWQLHERLVARENPAGWSPVDFGLSAWNATVAEAISLDQQRRLDELDDREAERLIQRLAEELQSLVTAIEQGRTPTASGAVIQAWNNWNRSMVTEPARYPWKLPSALPAAMQPRWQEIRGQYRDFLDSTSQLSHVLRLRAERCGERSGGPNEGEWIDSLTQLWDSLPDNTQATALQYPLPVSLVDSMQAAADDLRRTSESNITPVLELARSTAENDSQNALSWADERQLQLAMSDPLLSFRTRRLLFEAFDKLTSVNLNEPGSNNNSVDTSLEPSRLLSTHLRTEQASENFKDWTRLLHKSLKLATANRDLPPPGSTIDDINSWGKKMLARAADPGQSPRGKWMQSCLAGFGLFDDLNVADPAAMLVAVSDDVSLYFELVSPSLRLTASEPSQNTLYIDVKRGNATEVSRCQLQWRFADRQAIAARLASNAANWLRVIGPDGNEIDEGVAVSLPVAGRQIRLVFDSSLDDSQVPTGLPITISVAERESALEGGEQDFTVFLANPNRVDLVAKCVNPGQRADQWMLPTERGFGPVLDTRLSAPAVAGAFSAYELFLLNRSDSPKLIKASLYAVPGANRTVGNGTIDIESAGRLKRAFARFGSQPSPMFEAEPILLPASQAGSTSSLTASQLSQLNFTPVQTNVPDPDANPGEFGIVCLLQEIEQAEGQPPRNIGEPTFHWIECVPLNPTTELVRVTPKQSDGNFLLEVSIADWDRWGTEEVLIAATLADGQGGDVDMLAPARAALTRFKPNALLKVRPAKPPTGELTVHLSVGGYPRATYFQSRLQGGPPPQKESTPFVRLTHEAVAVFGEAGGEATELDLITRRENRRVVPNRIGVDATSNGAQVSVTRFEVPFRIDLPVGGAAAIVSTGSSFGSFDETRFQYDRKFRPSFSATEGKFIFAAEASDHVYRFENQGQLSGVVDVRVQIPRGPAATTTLVFDQSPPSDRARIETDANSLYSGETLEVSLAADDEESGIREVYLALDAGGTLNALTYDSQDIALGSATPSAESGWSMVLEADALEQLLKNSPTRVKHLVARAIDNAGNFQDDFAAAQFSLLGKKPVATAAKPPAKKKKRAAPPAATEHDVTVDVLVDGKVPKNADSIIVSGISGAYEAQRGNRRLFTKVPDGRYEITATYTDTFGVQYSGSSSLNLSAKSGSIVTINAVRQ